MEKETWATSRALAEKGHRASYDNVSFRASRQNMLHDAPGRHG